MTTGGVGGHSFMIYIMRVTPRYSKQCITSALLLHIRTIQALGFIQWALAFYKYISQSLWHVCDRTKSWQEEEKLETFYTLFTHRNLIPFPPFLLPRALYTADNFSFMYFPERFGQASLLISPKYFQNKIIMFCLVF